MKSDPISNLFFFTICNVNVTLSPTIVLFEDQNQNQNQNRPLVLVWPVFLNQRKTVVNARHSDAMSRVLL